MKKIVIIILTILFVFLPLFSMESRTANVIFIVLWPIVSISLVVLYIRWFNPNNISNVSERLNKNNHFETEKENQHED